MLDQYSKMMEESRMLGNRMRSNPHNMQMEPALLVFFKLKMRPLII